MKIQTHKDLNVWKNGIDAAMEIFEITKYFPKQETYSMVDQIRRSSRSVVANVAEAWRKRRYKAAFVSKLSDAESEAGETQTWIEFGLRCGYITTQTASDLEQKYDVIIRQLITMINTVDKWTISPSPNPLVSLSPCQSSKSRR